MLTKALQSRWWFPVWWGPHVEPEGSRHNLLLANAMMVSGHIGTTLCEQTDTTENITFPVAKKCDIHSVLCLVATGGSSQPTDPGPTKQPRNTEPSKVTEGTKTTKTSTASTTRAATTSTRRPALEPSPTPGKLTFTNTSHKKTKETARCMRVLVVTELFSIKGASKELTHGLFTLPDSDLDSHSDLDSKPNDYIALCRSFHAAESDSDSNPDCQQQEWDRNQSLYTSPSSAV